MLSLNNLIGFGGSGVTGSSQSFGAFFAWGDNTNGQGGDNGAVNPLLVPTNTNTTTGIFIQSASYNDAFHMVFLIDNNLFTAGLNQYGQLCLDDTADRAQFTAVLINGDNITDVVCGGDHTLVIRDGEIYGSGRNKQDQLTNSEPNQINALSLIVESADMGDGDAIKVHASAYSSAVRTSNNEVYTWGNQIGIHLLQK